MKTLSIKLDDALHARVTTRANLRGVARSEVVRDAILAYLKSIRISTRLGSALEFARDLVGCITGPSDLSTSKGRLRKFGRA